MSNHIQQYKTMTKDELRELIKENHAGIDGEVLEYLTDKINTKAVDDDDATEQVKALTATSIAQSYADSRVNQAQKKWRRQAKESKDVETTQAGATDETTDTNADATLREIQALKEQLNALKAERTKEQRTTAINKLIDTLPEPLRAPFKYIETDNLTDEGFTSFLEELKTDVDQITSTLPKGGFTPPRKPGVSTMETGKDEITEAEIDELIKLADI